jgi:hypothetical protein
MIPAVPRWTRSYVLFRPLGMDDKGQRYGAPRDADALEGWIADPTLNLSTLMRNRLMRDVLLPQMQRKSGRFTKGGRWSMIGAA